MSSPSKDFDPVTGKLENVSKLKEEYEACFVGDPGNSFRIVPGPSALANPLALAPTGSPPGKWALADVARAGVTLFTSYGFLQTIVAILQCLGMHPSELGQYGAEIAAVSMALAHLIVARQADNSPRVP